eukprot:1384237-Pleurochrysis_carterae.AAC.3
MKYVYPFDSRGFYVCTATHTHAPPALHLIMLELACDLAAPNRQFRQLNTQISPPRCVSTDLRTEHEAMPPTAGV